MTLSDLGALAAQLGPQERTKLGNELIQGRKDVANYTSGICFDVTAFVRFLMVSRITHHDLLVHNGQAWIELLGFKESNRTEWDGISNVPAGTAVGFWRLQGETFFHAAIAAGDKKIRSVNSLQLGPGWSQAVDMKTVLGERDGDGYFSFDGGAKVKVYLSTV